MTKDLFDVLDQLDLSETRIVAFPHLANSPEQNIYELDLRERLESTASAFKRPHMTGLFNRNMDSKKSARFVKLPRVKVNLALLKTTRGGFSTMGKTSHWIDYEQQMNHVTDYIYDHLDDQLDLNRLADVACMSPYHWHRVYSSLRGETVAATVKRLRLQRAAGYLAQTSLPVKEIAERAGYGNLQSFTRIFSSVYGMPPASYREKGDHAQFQPQDKRPAAPQTEYEVTVRDVPDMKVLAVDHTGSYMEIGKAFDKLYNWLGARNLIGPEMRSIGIYYDDPTTVPEDQLKSQACALITEQPTVEPPLVKTEIPGGPYAVLKHKGPYSTMRAAYQWLFGEWLAQSGKELADAPVFEEYLNSPYDTPPNELVTEIFLPLK